jgi:site-specific DNA-methyltransferase (adenine-specific)
VSPYDASIDLHDSYYAAVGELRRRRVADRLRVEHGDCLEVIPRLVAEGVTVDAIVTDPPYHLTDIAARAARPFRARDGLQANGAMSRLAAGFMGQRWDGDDVAFRPETWAAAFTILRPGGYLVAFGGTRTYHRLACAIEDAGFVIQDQLAWLYGSGFPKHRSHLKPAHEPICLAYKPGGPRTLGVDECRVDGAPEATRFDPAKHNHDGWRFTDTGAETYARAMGRDGEASAEQRYTGNGASDFAALPGPRGGSPAGRWPANVVHDGSEEVLAGFPELGRSVGGRIGNAGGGTVENVPVGRYQAGDPGFGDSGSAARFFYSAKADAADRWGSRHPTVKPVDLIRWLVTLVTPPGGTFLDPFAGSGTAAVAALASGRDAILIEREAAYVADIRERIAHYAGEGRHSLVAKGRARREPAAGSLL